MTGVGVASVYNVLREYKADHKFKPPKSYHRSKPILDNIDEGIKSGVRRIIHQFYLRNEPPTIAKIMLAINDNEELPNFKKTTLRALLKEIGFR